MLPTYPLNLDRSSSTLSQRLFCPGDVAGSLKPYRPSYAQRRLYQHPADGRHGAGGVCLGNPPGRRRRTTKPDRTMACQPQEPRSRSVTREGAAEPGVWKSAGQARLRWAAQSGPRLPTSSDGLGPWARVKPCLPACCSLGTGRAMTVTVASETWSLCIAPSIIFQTRSLASHCMPVCHW